MKIAALGTGHVGGALGNGWARAGHEVVFGTRTPQSAEVKQLLKDASKAKSASLSEAGAAADVIALAVPWKAARRRSQSDQRRRFRQSAHRLYESCERVARYGSLWADLGASRSLDGRQVRGS